MRPYIFRASCSECGECIIICPYDVFADNDGTVNVLTPEDCIECGACAEHCRQKAIYFDD